MAELLLHRKDIIKEGDIIEQKAWKVEKSDKFPEGIKYALVYIHNGERILGYDNERAKRHHKHYFDMEIEYNFIGFEKLIDDFEADVKKLRKVLYENQEN